MSVAWQTGGDKDGLFQSRAVRAPVAAGQQGRLAATVIRHLRSVSSVQSVLRAVAFMVAVPDSQCCDIFRWVAKWLFYTYIYKYFHILFFYRDIILYLLQILLNTEYSFCFYTIGPWWLSILYVVSVNSNPSFIFRLLPLGNHKFVLKICESIAFVNKFIRISSLDSTHKWNRVILLSYFT